MRPTECSEGQAGGGGDPVVRNRDVNTRAVFRFGFWLAVGVAAVTLAMLGLFRTLAPMPTPGVPPAVPGEQSR